MATARRCCSHALKSFLDTALTRISRKSSLALAIRYATMRWSALSRFTSDGRLELSNNAAERAIRPLALGSAMRALLRFFTSARLLGMVVLLLVVVLAALHWLAELFWFQALGYAEVFWRLLLCQLGLFAAATCLVFIYAWGNLRLLARHVDLIGTARDLDAERDGPPRWPHHRPSDFV